MKNTITPIVPILVGKIYTRIFFASSYLRSILKITYIKHADPRK